MIRRAILATVLVLGLAPAAAAVPLSFDQATGTAGLPRCQDVGWPMTAYNYKGEKFIKLLHSDGSCSWLRVPGP